VRVSSHGENSLVVPASTPVLETVVTQTPFLGILQTSKGVKTVPTLFVKTSSASLLIGGKMSSVIHIRIAGALENVPWTLISI